MPARGVGLAAGERLVEHVEQLADHDRRRDLGVVLHRAAHVREQQARARGEDGLEEEVAILVAWRAIAAPRVLGDEIEAGRAPLAREGAVVHAEQADDAGRDAPHGQERADGDAAREEGVLAPGLGDGSVRLQPGADDVERDGLVEAGGVGFLRQIEERPADGLELVGAVVAFGDHAVQRGAERVAPALDRAGVAERSLHVEERLAERGEAAEEVGLAALHVVERERVAEEHAPLARHRIAEQEPVEAEAPGGLLERRLLEARAVGRVHAPADVGPDHPAPHRVELVLADGELVADRLAPEEARAPRRR